MSVGLSSRDSGTSVDTDPLQRNDSWRSSAGRRLQLLQADPVAPSATLVMDHSVTAIGKPTQRDRGSVHLAQKPFECSAVVLFQLAVGIHIEAKMLPRQEALHGLWEDLLLLERHVEEGLPEEFLEAREVDALHGEVQAVVSEEPEGDRGLNVGVRREKVAKGL